MSYLVGDVAREQSGMSDPHSPRAFRENPFTLVLLCAIVFATAVNVGQFAAIEKASGSHAALQHRSAIALDAIGEHDGVERGFTTIRTRYLPYLKLGRVAEGAHIRMKPEVRLSEIHLRAFARVASVTTDETVPRLTSADVAEIAEFIAYEGEHHRVGEYAIVTGGLDPSAYLGLEGPDRFYFIDARLLDGREGPQQ